MAELGVATGEFAHGGLRLRVASPSPRLAPYISAYYRTEVDPGVVIEDWLPPEEANLRTGVADIYEAAIGADGLAPVPAAVVSGPTDRVTRLWIGGGRFWGIGLTPAGWARLIARPAAAWANRFVDTGQSAMAPALVGMLETLRHEIDDMAEAAEIIENTLGPMLDRSCPVEAQVQTVHLHILSVDVTSVAALTELAGMNERTLARFCKRHYAFAPGALLRRQRFLRSLGQYMLDPSLRWINSLDPNYWDQAQFIRDFRAIMQMTPSEYAALPHPIVTAAVAVTQAGSGVALQALFHPDRQVESETGL